MPLGQQLAIRGIDRLQRRKFRMMEMEHVDTPAECGVFAHALFFELGERRNLPVTGTCLIGTFSVKIGPCNLSWKFPKKRKPGC